MDQWSCNQTQLSCVWNCVSGSIVFPLSATEHWQSLSFSTCLKAFFIDRNKHLYLNNHRRSGFWSPRAGAPVFLLLLHPLDSGAVLSDSPRPASSMSGTFCLQQRWLLCSCWTLLTVHQFDFCRNTGCGTYIQDFVSAFYRGLAALAIPLRCRQKWRPEWLRPGCRGETVTGVNGWKFSARGKTYKLTDVNIYNITHVLACK